MLSLHSLSSTRNPSQSEPLFIGGRLVQVRVLFWVPVPQEELQRFITYVEMLLFFHLISLCFSCDLAESFNSESTQHKSAKFVLGPSCFSDRTLMQRAVRFFIILGTFSIRFFVGNGKPQTAKCHMTTALRSRLQFAVHV